MISVIYHDVSNNDFTCFSEFDIKHLTPSVLRRIVTMTIFDIQSDVDCHTARAYIFFDSCLGDVKHTTNFDSTKLLIMCNVLITSMARTDENDEYHVNTWIDRDKELVSYLYSSKNVF